MTTIQDGLNLERVEFKPKEATREEWDRYHIYRKIRHKERRPEDPITPDEIVEKSLKHDNPFSENKMFLYADAGKIVSLVAFGVNTPKSPDYENNKHLIWGGGSVLAEYRRKGIGKSWLPLVVELMDEWDRTVFSTGAEEDFGHAFLKWLGAEERFIGHENRLKWDEIDWELVRRWVKEGEERNAETKLEFFENRLPESLLEEYCVVYTQLGNMAPREDLDMGDWVSTPETWAESYKQADELGSHHHTYLTREPDGSISGLTEVWYLPARKEFVGQDLTGVLPEYRGRGLGKWLKAAMLEYVRERYEGVTWVVTGNAHSNDPMLHINKTLGFKEYKTGSEYQISRDDLRKKAESLG